MNKTISFKASPAQVEFLESINDESISSAIEDLFTLAGFDKFNSGEGTLKVYQEYNFHSSSYVFSNGLKSSPKFKMPESIFNHSERYLGTEILYLSMIACELFTPAQLENAPRVEIVNLVSGVKLSFSKASIKKILGNKREGETDSLL